VVRHSAALLSLAVLCNGSDALAQNPRDVFKQFAGVPQSVVTNAVQAEWRKSPDAEITCVGQNLRPAGSSKSALIEQGIPHSDGGVVPERASCRIQMAQSILLTELTQTRPYGVDGLALGTKVAFGTPAYRQYRCIPSQKFEGFVWCTKTISDREGRGRFKAWFSILHAQDGAVVYVNRYQEPAYWSASEVADDIQRYSRRIGEEPHIIQLPVRPGLPKGTLATWGKVVLEPIVGDELRLLGEDKPLKKGIAIDFIGNFSQSARQGLPIYRLAGGAGIVWAASYNQSGRGTLRFSAVDASTYSPLPPPVIISPPVAMDPPGAAETAVDAQPTSPPGTTFPSPVDATAPPRRRGEQLDCSAGPDCDAPTSALSSVVAPPRDPNDVIAQVLNYSTTQLQQTDPADGARQYARESAASNFGTKEWKQGMLDLVVAYWFWLISALIVGGPAGYRLIRLQIARGRGSADEARRAVQAKAAEEARRVAEAQAAEDARCAAEAQAAEDARRAAEAQAAEDARRAAEAQAAEDARRIAEAKAAEDARRTAEAKAAEDARRTAEAKAAEEARRAAEAKAAEDARRIAEAKAAEDARRAAEAKAAEDARRAEEAKAAEEARRAAEVHAAEGGPGVAKANAAEDTRRDAKAKGNNQAASVLKAKAVIKTKARGVTKAKSAKEAGGAAEVKAAEEAPRVAKRSAAAIRRGRSPKGPAPPPCTSSRAAAPPVNRSLLAQHQERDQRRDGREGDRNDNDVEPRHAGSSERTISETG
jgi:hypothetical protein